MADPLTAQQAAKRAGVSLSGLRTLAERARRGGANLRRPSAEWPDARTPLYDAEQLDAYLATRPGRGRRRTVAP